MKVLVVNQHTNNFGDDAAGVALVTRLLEYNIEQIELLYCMPGTLPIDDPRVVHNHSLNVREFKKIDYIIYALTKIKCGKFIPGLLKKLKEYDVVIVSPCGSNLGIYKDWQLLLQDMIIIQKKKLIFHLNTIAESGNKLFDYMVKYVCSHSQVYVRERASEKYLTDNGIAAKWGPDTAFLLESKGSISRDDNRIIFVPSDVWSWHVDFINKSHDVFENVILPGLSTFAKDNDKQICILAHTNSKAEHEFNLIVKNKLNRLAPEIDIVVPQIKTVYDYENYIRSSFCVIGMRYHSIVLAAKNAIPFIAISYEQKMQEVSNYTHQENFCIDLKIQDQMNLFGKLLDDLLFNHDKITNELLLCRDELINEAAIVLREQFYNIKTY